MSYHAFVSTLTLIAFLPLAVGCSSRRTVRPEDDPGGADAAADLRNGRALRIAGYTTRAGESRDWDGEVQLVSADSLEFSPHRWSGQTALEVEPGFRLALDEVQSLEVIETDTGRSVATVALVLAVGALVLTIAVAHAMSEAFNQDNWFQGSR